MSQIVVQYDILHGNIHLAVIHMEGSQGIFRILLLYNTIAASSPNSMSCCQNNYLLAFNQILTAEPEHSPLELSLPVRPPWGLLP